MKSKRAFLAEKRMERGLERPKRRRRGEAQLSYDEEIKGRSKAEIG